MTPESANHSLLRKQIGSSRTKMLSLMIVAILGWICICPPAGGATSVDATVVRVGAYENRPKIYTNAQGVIVGIFPDILDTIAFKEGWRLEYVFGTWRQCLQRLEHNEIDVMVDVAFSLERQEKYIFSEETVFVNWGTVYTRQDVAINFLPDLGGKTVAVMKGSIHTDGADGIKQLASKFDFGLKYIEVDNYDDVLRMIHSGAADAGVVNRLYGALAEKRYNVKKTSLVFNPVQLKFAYPKNATPKHRYPRPYRRAFKGSQKRYGFDSLRDHRRLFGRPRVSATIQG